MFHQYFSLIGFFNFIDQITLELIFDIQLSITGDLDRIGIDDIVTGEMYLTVYLTTSSRIMIFSCHRLHWQFDEPGKWSDGIFTMAYCGSDLSASFFLRYSARYRAPLLRNGFIFFRLKLPVARRAIDIHQNRY